MNDEMKNVLKIVNRLNLDDPKNVETVKCIIEEGMLKTINNEEPITNEDFYTFGFLLQKLIAKERGLKLNFGGFNNEETRTLGLHHRDDEKSVNEIDINFSHSYFSKLKQGEKSDRIEKVYSLAVFVFNIEHEFRHEWQDNYIKNTKNLNATTLIIAKELANFNRFQNFYNSNHDDFLIELDANHSAYVNTPITLKKYFPFLSDYECNILDLDGYEKRKLKQRIKNYKNTVWEILSSKLTKLENSISTGESELLALANLADESDDICKISSRGEIKQILTEMPILNFIYSRNGKKKKVERIIKEYNQFRKQINEGEVSITGDLEADLIRCEATYFSILNEEPKKNHAEENELKEN